MKKNVLGKGLSSLIPNYENVDNSTSETNKNNYIDIDINLIKANTNQPRKFFDEDSIISLAESIQIHGIIQPLIVSEKGKFYMIIAGERRYRAAKHLNLSKIPCLIVEKSDEEILEISLIENIQRQDLNPIEEAHAFKNLIDNFNITQEALSKKLSLSRSSVTNKLRLLKLSNVVQDYILNEEISEGHAKILVSIKDENLQIEISNKIIDESLNVRQTEKLVQMLNNNTSKKEPKNIINNTYITSLKTKLENYFGTKVSINDKKNKGNIQIEYYSPEDLNRILGLIYLDEFN